jgi:hypothetical protein
MRGKAMLLIASGAAAAVGLLVVRQQRLQAVYEMTRALERASEHENAVLRIRAQIAEATRPEHLVRMASSLGPMIPIPRELCPSAGEWKPGLHPRRARPERDLTRAEPEE